MHSVSKPRAAVSEEPITIRHESMAGVFPDGSQVDFDVSLYVPFSVRRMDISIIAKDMHNSANAIRLEIDGITSTNELSTCINEASKVFSLFFNPPQQFQGNFAGRLTTINPLTGQWELLVAPHDLTVVINLAFHNQY
jgi:hypothetical protein